MPTLTLCLLPTPETADGLTPLEREQLSVILQNHPTEWHELVELFAVHDESGAHIYDMHLFCGDDGQVFRAGTTQHVASFCQGGADSRDAELERTLDEAHERFRKENG